jgi:hypothetical protein
MDITSDAKKVWGLIRSPKTIAIFKVAAAVLGVGVAVEGLVKAIRNEEKK